MTFYYIVTLVVSLITERAQAFGENIVETYSSDEYYDTLVNHLSPSYQMDFTLKVALTFTSTKTIHQIQLPNGSLTNIYGTTNIAYSYILDLQEIFHFRIEFVPSVGWITEGRNGELTGVGAQVFYGQADIGLDLAKPAGYRLKHLTFLHGIRQDRVAIMFKQPRIQISRNILYRPFKDGVWKRVLQSVFLIILSSMIVARRKHISVLVSIYGAVLARSIDFPKSFHSPSLKVVLLVSSIFGLTMYSIYSAFIVSSLRRPDFPIKSFNDLIDFDYELIAQSSLPDFTNVYFTDQRLGRKYADIAKKNFVNEQTSLKRLFQKINDDSVDGVAWFVLVNDFYYLALHNNYSQNDICRISSLVPTSRSEHPRILSMFLAKRDINGSKYPVEGKHGMKEHFNRRILDIMARGLGHRHILQFESEFKPRCLRYSGVRRPQEVRISDVYAAFGILFLGACVAIGIFLVVEVLGHFLCKKAAGVRNIVMMD